MGLDVEPPDPPSLRDPEDPGDYEAVDEPEDRLGDDYRRGELAGFLEEGAWEQAFDEWAAHTWLTEDEFALVAELGLLDRLDLYWNPSRNDVGYRVPPLPDPPELPPPFDDQFDAGDLDGIEAEVDALARTVTEVIENEYLDRDDEGPGFFADR